MADRVSVLHVDDDPKMLDVLSKYLHEQHQQFEVESVASAEDALDRLDEQSIDCIVSDYSMEPIDGIEFLERVRESDPDRPFILFTMRGNEQVASDAIEAGATDYIVKQSGGNQFDLLANRIRNTVEQYRAKQRAKRTQQRLEELTEAATDVLWTYTGDWEELLFVNSSFEELFGLQSEELYDRPSAFLDATHPDDRDRVRAAMDRLSEGEPVDIEFRVDESEDFGRWVWVDAKPIFDEDGEVARIVGYSRDITDRKERNRELKELKGRYQAYLENASDLITVLEDDATITYQSPSVERVLGYEVDELVGESAFEYVHPDDRTRVNEAFADLKRSEPDTTVTEKFRMRRADGTWLWVESIGTNRTGTTLDGYVITSRDISTRKRREQTLSALHNAAQEIERADEPAIVYEILSEAAEDVLEFDLVAVDVEHDGDLVQEAWTLDLEDGDYYDRTSLDDDDTFAVRAYNRQETVLVDDLRETTITPADSEYRSVLTVPIGRFGTFQAVSREEGAFDRRDVEFAEQLVGHVQVKLDQLQDRRALEERTAELERQNDRLDEFVSVVSHDLRNPVGVARGRVNILQSELDNEHLDEIEWAVDRMETLIEDLLSLARNGAVVDEFEPVELGELLENCWRSVETARATLTVRTDRTIMADQDRCRQLVENLLRNAVEHGGEGVEITVGDVDGGFYVADDGVGIPPDERDRVFETGYSTADDGTGFGLNIVGRIATAHDWAVQVTDGPDGGARFEFTGVEIADEAPKQ